jgi:uncharacterized protein (DUF1330 family)
LASGKHTVKIDYFVLAALLVGIVFGGAAVQELNAQSRAPTYVITEIEVTDAEAFREYAPRVQPSFTSFGGRYLVRGGKTQSFAGEQPKRVVVLAFDSMERAQSWYASPEYEVLKALRDKAGKARIFAAEGLAP